MSFWEDWEIEKPVDQMTDVVGLNEKDFDPIITVLNIAQALKTEEKLPKSTIAYKVLTMAAEDKNVQVILINALTEGLEIIMGHLAKDLENATEAPKP